MWRPTTAQRVTVEEHDPRRDPAASELDGDRGAERVTDDDRLRQPERLAERLYLVAPVLQRPWPAALGVAEPVEVERVDAVALREQRRNLLPHERRLEKAPDQDDRRAARSPLAVRGAVDRLAVPELADRHARVRRGGVADHRGERQRDDEAEQRVEDPANHPHAPTLETAGCPKVSPPGSDAVDGFRRQVA